MILYLKSNLLYLKKKEREEGEKDNLSFFAVSLVGLLPCPQGLGRTFFSGIRRYVGMFFRGTWKSQGFSNLTRLVQPGLDKCLL